MAQVHAAGGWSYRGFTVRYRRVSDGEATAGPDALWGAAILEATEVARIAAPTYGLAQKAAEHAIDSLIAQGHPTPTLTPTPQRRGCYHRITAYLARVPDTQKRVVLSFAELEELLGRPLAVTARTVASYWTTASPGRTQGWNAAGWKAGLRTNKECVVFTRIVRQEE